MLYIMLGSKKPHAAQEDLDLNSRPCGLISKLSFEQRNFQSCLTYHKELLFSSRVENSTAVWPEALK